MAQCGADEERHAPIPWPVYAGLDLEDLTATRSPSDERQELQIHRIPPHQRSYPQPTRRQSDPRSHGAGDAAAARRRRQDAARRRIGDYEFRESDYTQVLIWAKAVGMSPEELVATLEEREWGSISVVDGAVTSLMWRFEGVELDLSHVPRLEWLYCGENHLGELDLSRVPKLTELHCRENQLTELDLSRVPTRHHARAAGGDRSQAAGRDCRASV